VRALLAFAEKATRDPAGIRREDVEALRREGLEDRAIHDGVQVAAYFNYINRVADALGVDLEPGMAPYPHPRGT
jgi:alkylhydroperoxidase family enzyme